MGFDEGNLRIGVEGYILKSSSHGVEMIIDF